MALKVFVDSDVIISSLISSTGSAFLLLNQTGDIEFYISNISMEELERVMERLNLDASNLKRLAKKRFTIFQLGKTAEEVKKQFSDYVLDIDDAHIVAGAVRAKVQFLISYNTKHFKSDKLRKNFNIILSTPANFIQYLRSL